MDDYGMVMQITVVLIASQPGFFLNNQGTQKRDDEP